MRNFLDNLGLGSSGIDVYVAVSSSGKIEMALLDDSKTEIKSYAQLPIEYNDAQREIANIDNFAKIVEQLFSECNINPQKANVHMSLPTVWFGYKDDIPLILDENAITNVVIGELEQSYIFKRKTPLPLWFEAPNTDPQKRSAFYSAVQKESKELIEEAFASFGAKLVSLTCSLFTDIKGLIKAEVLNEEVNDEEYNWGLMIINNSGFQLYSLKGKKFVGYIEEPIALRTYEGEEIYSAINNSAQIALMSLEANTLVVISETDLVSANYLIENLQFGAKIVSVEDNKYKKEPLANIGLNVLPEDQIKVSLNTIGLIDNTDSLPIPTDYLVPIGQKKTVVQTIEIPITKDYTLVLTPQKALLYSAILLGVVLLPLLILLGTFMSLNNNATAENERLSGEIAEIDAQLSKYERQSSGGNFNPSDEIINTMKNNRIKIMAYTSLGESIPKNLYLTYFMTGEDGYIDIKGCANSVEDVYVFFKNVKDSLYESNLRLNKLDLKTGSIESVINSDTSNIDEAPYIFEITNMTDEQISSFMNSLRAKDQNSEDSENKNKYKNKDKE